MVVSGVFNIGLVEIECFQSPFGSISYVSLLVFAANCFCFGAQLLLVELEFVACWLGYFGFVEVAWTYFDHNYVVLW